MKILNKHKKTIFISMVTAFTALVVGLCVHGVGIIKNNAKQVTSATYEQEFDSDTISQMVANKRGISQQEVLEEWRIENLHSTIKGSIIHEFAQSLWEGKEYKFDYSNIPPEIDLDRLKSDIKKLIPQAINFYNDYKDMYELIGCEIYLGD